MNEGKGVYFHPETAALSRVADSQLDLSTGWIRISDDLSLGLLDARRVIEERGLSDDATSIDWLEMTVANWEQQRRVPQLIREKQRDSERLREMAQKRPIFLHRLTAGRGSNG